MVACGSDDGGGGGTRDQFGQCAGTEGQTCTGIEEYNKCIVEKCDAELKAAFGENYSSGTFDGPCGKVVDCFNACPCDANYKTCQNKCISDYMSNSACQSALMAAGNCAGNSGCPLPKCESSGGGGGGGGEKCEQLRACCDEAVKKAPTMETACTAYKQLNDETQCQAVIDNVMKPAGFCE